MTERWEEFTACAECDAQEPIAKCRAYLDTLRVCQACGATEGETRQLVIDHETGEITPA